MPYTPFSPDTPVRLAYYCSADDTFRLGAAWATPRERHRRAPLGRQESWRTQRLGTARCHHRPVSLALGHLFSLLKTLLWPSEQRSRQASPQVGFRANVALSHAPGQAACVSAHIRQIVRLVIPLALWRRSRKEYCDFYPPEYPQTSALYLRFT